MPSNSKTTAEYIAVATAYETPPGTAYETPPEDSVDAQRPPEGKKVDKKKKSRCLCMCFSNMQFENEEEKEKTMAFLKSEESKLAMVMCCSNFQLGPNVTKVPTTPAK
ncbi:hypothetical protein V6N13_085306 [Hibiscus sabdariffa]|uniref:Uncharacterized protein n=1 Tax=Hibiscus sabdariffa TaxID=183260 RepID=A0ABR2D213_9ROSI